MPKMAETAEVTIHLENVCFSYEKDAPVLNQISFDASGNESIGIIGANGVGKSTLSKLLVGLNVNYEGTLEICGTPVRKETLPQIRRRVGYVFQDSDSQLFSSTVGEDVAFAPRNYGLPADEVNARVADALARTGIPDLKDKHTYKLSGGQKKLASIATILSMTPDILLMDEPSAALDPRNRRNLINLLNSLDLMKLLTSHDLDFIWDTCRRTILMADGRIIADGPTGDILRDRALLEAHGLELPLSLSRGGFGA